MRPTLPPRARVYAARGGGTASVIGMRYDATELMQGATEVLAYGTAVLIEQKRPE